MTTRTYNIVSCAVFGALTLILLVGGFYNPVHWLFASVTASLVNLSLHDDSDGESLIDEITDYGKAF